MEIGMKSGMRNGNKNRGSIVVEATLVLPIFIIALLCFYQMGQSRLALGFAYEAGIETAEYMAEYAYLNQESEAVPYMIFHKYVDCEDLLSRYVSGRTAGVTFFGSDCLDEEDYVNLQMQCNLKIVAPFLGGLSANKKFVIRQHAYVGRDISGNTSGEEIDSYVYLSDNRDVYHTRRNCSHLRLTIFATSYAVAVQKGYLPCDFCGTSWSEQNDKAEVLITESGNKYHGSATCSGLKRTVYRVKKSEIGGIPPCSRCGN